MNVFNIKNEGMFHTRFQNYTPTSEIKKGDIVLIGGTAFVADVSAVVGNNLNFSATRGGEYQGLMSDITGASTSTAIGTALYITPDGATVTTTDTGNIKLGVITEVNSDNVIFLMVS